MQKKLKCTSGRVCSASNSLKCDFNLENGNVMLAFAEYKLSQQAVREMMSTEKQKLEQLEQLLNTKYLHLSNLQKRNAEINFISEATLQLQTEKEDLQQQLDDTAAKLQSLLSISSDVDSKLSHMKTMNIHATCASVLDGESVQLVKKLEDIEENVAQLTSATNRAKEVANELNEVQLELSRIKQDFGPKLISLTLEQEALSLVDNVNGKE